MSQCPRICCSGCRAHEADLSWSYGLIHLLAFLRRLQNLGGMVTAKGLVPAPLPSWASEICKKLTADTQVFGGDANHILVNEYPPGGGIMVSSLFPARAVVSLPNLSHSLSRPSICRGCA